MTWEEFDKLSQIVFKQSKRVEELERRIQILEGRLDARTPLHLVDDGAGAWGEHEEGEGYRESEYQTNEL